MSKTHNSKDRLSPRLVWTGAVVCAGATAATGAVMLLLGDRWWPATLLAYGPRWPILVPTCLMLPVVLFLRQWTAGLVLGLALAFALGPYMGFCAPVGRAAAPPDRSAAITVVAFNAGYTTQTAPLRSFVDDSEAAVIVVPECRWLREGDPSPLEGFDARRSHGVCIFSRFPIRKFIVRDPTDVWEQAGSGDISLARISGPRGPFSVLAVHLETVREGLENLIHDHSPQKLTEVTQLRWHESRLAREFAEQSEDPLLVVGDFNMPVESAIYSDVWSGFGNGFSSCGLGYGHTKQTRWFGIRIDHVLMDDRWQCIGARVGPDLGSDHRPLAVDLLLPPP